MRQIDTGEHAEEEDDEGHIGHQPDDMEHVLCEL